MRDFANQPMKPRPRAKFRTTELWMTLAEYPELNQQNEAEDHRHNTGIEQKNEPVSGIELFESLSHFGPPPEVGNPLVLGQPFVYLSYHHEGNHIGQNSGGCPEATRN